MTTLIVCMKRRADLSREAFEAHWRDIHAPLVKGCADFARHLTGYVQHHPIDRSSPIAAMFGVSGDYDGVAQLDFHSREAMTLAFAEPAFLRDVQPDEANFFDPVCSLAFVTEPFDVLGGRVDLFSVTGKIAVVTGGAKGVGAMISAALANAGVRLFVIGRTDPEGFVATLPGATFLAHDLATAQGVRDAAQDVADRTPEVHILVNNAGSFSAAPVDVLDEATWDHELALDLRAPFFLVQALLPQLKAAAAPGDPARVVNIGSIAALWAKSSSAYAYGAAKAGVHQLTRMLASDLTAQGITVNAVAPGFFPSDMTAGFFAAVPGLKEQMIAGIPAGRLGEPADVGGAVIFLASRAGAYLSGAVLPVEGGLWSA